MRVLKPGGHFVGLDWVITDKFDAKNPEHVRIKKEIEIGNGVADLVRPGEVLRTLKEAGFEILESKDMGELKDPSTELGWWDSLVGGYTSIEGIKHSHAFFVLTGYLLWTLESLRIAPKGTGKVHNLLVKVAIELVKGGQLQIFSPCFFYLCRKPLNGKSSKQ